MKYLEVREKIRKRREVRIKLMKNKSEKRKQKKKKRMTFLPLKQIIERIMFPVKNKKY